MMSLSRLIDILSSKVLTVWMAVLFVFYYLTVSVWLGEAFGRFIHLISHNNMARAIYILFFINVSLRIVRHLWKIRVQKTRLILSLPLYTGIVVFLLFSFLSVNLRQVIWSFAGEGDIINIPWDKTPYMVVKIESALKRDILRFDSDGVFDDEPHVIIANTLTLDRYKVGAFPAKKVGMNYIHILNFGLAPVLTLYEGEKVLASGPVILRLIPFGVVDSFDLQKYGYKFFMHIIPNRIVKRDKEIARNYNLIHPRYQLQILKGDQKVFDGEADDEVTFDGKVLKLHSPIYWVQLEIVKDPVYPFFLIGLLLILLGMVVYPFGYLLRR